MKPYEVEEMSPTIKLLEKIENTVFVRVIRDGLRMLIPVLMVGSLALIMRSLPVAAYQSFINSFASGFLYLIFSYIYNATFGMLSVYMVICLSYCSFQHRERKIGTVIGTISAGLVAFFISVGFLTHEFDLESLSPVGMFTAIVCGLLAPALYQHLRRHLPRITLFTDGSEPTFNRAVINIIPLGIVSLVFAFFNYLAVSVLEVDNSYQLFSIVMNLIFNKVGRSFWGGFLYVFFSSFMWFFGIHGSNVLESVNKSMFEVAATNNTALVAIGMAPTELYTKTFFDVFVLMGGCGCALSLLVALLLFSNRRSSRSVAKMTAIPMLFNINELMIFGLPVAYNPALFIPFILAPMASFLISSAAMTLELVPYTSSAVEWTTPIILGGYQSTGSIAGAILQVVNLTVGVLIYMPFVKLYDKHKEREALANIERLTQRLKANEAMNRDTPLAGDKSILGDIAKQLILDLRGALANESLYLLFQPQHNADGDCIGAEALLRWKHPVFGLIYPPLVVKLAEEGGMLEDLEKAIFLMAKRDMESSGFDRRISINLTSASLQTKGFADFLVETFPEAKAGHASICVEITEQRELLTNTAMMDFFDALRSHGFSLAIDDFSMGFTSIKYLQEGRFDEVKLDGSLVRSLTDSPRTQDIISSIIYLSSSLGFSVLAEFVETQEQQKELEALGCRSYQGYLFSKPLSLDELMAFVEKCPIKL